MNCTTLGEIVISSSINIRSSCSSKLQSSVSISSSSPKRYFGSRNLRNGAVVWKLIQGGKDGDLTTKTQHNLHVVPDNPPK